MQSHGSCAARVLILIDIADLASAKNAPNGDLSSECVAAAAPSAARFVDTLRLSVLRVLTQLCEARARDGHRVEWATRFFDSRPAGIGKTPAELKAKLRSRQAAQGTRSFGRVTQASFEAFGDACEAVACGVLGDPLARDRDTALRRWRHGQRKHQAASQALTASSWCVANMRVWSLLFAIASIIMPAASPNRYYEYLKCNPPTSSREGNGRLEQTTSVKKRAVYPAIMQTRGPS